MPAKEVPVIDLCAKARFDAAKVMPYASRALWAMNFIVCDDPSLKTLGIDEKWRVYVNPEYIKKCHADGTLVCEVLHELTHALRRHAARSRIIRVADHQLWNQCADIEDDAMVQEALTTFLQRNPKAKWKLVDDRVTCESLGVWPGFLAEEYYRQLQQKGQKGQGGNQQQPQGQQQGQQQGQGQGSQGRPHKHGKCGGGSGVTGKKEAWEGPSSGGGGGGQEVDKAGKPLPQGLSDAEQDVICAQVAQAIKDRVEKKGRGSVPADWLVWAEEIGQAPRIDWCLLAPAKIRNAATYRRGPKPTYARPSRRQAGGLILPVHRTPMPKVKLVFDTSASMKTVHDDGESDLAKGLGVVFQACLDLGHVAVVPCDAQAYDEVEVSHVDELKDFLKGGGGTDLVAGMRTAEEDGMADVIVVITDGGTPWPEEPLDTPVVIVLTTDPEEIRQFCAPPPAWCEVIAAYE